MNNQYRNHKCNELNMCSAVSEIIYPTNSTTNNIILIEYELNIDKSAKINNSISNSDLNFFNRFSKVIYSNQGVNYQLGLVIRNNEYLKNVVYADIPKSILNVESYSLAISTRSENYIIKIK